MFHSQRLLSSFGTVDKFVQYCKIIWVAIWVINNWNPPQNATSVNPFPANYCQCSVVVPLHYTCLNALSDTVFDKKLFNITDPFTPSRFVVQRENYRNALINCVVIHISGTFKRYELS